MSKNLPVDAVGLCAGRHDIPVTEYIFDKVEDVTDFKTLSQQAFRFVQKSCNLRTTWGAGVNQTDYTDVQIVRGDHLDVVVTGLTACTTAVMYACACNGVNLTLWHYDRNTDGYVPQHFYF